MAGDFVLNTENMDEAAKGCQTLAEKMQDLKDKIGNLQSDLAFCWDGKGHNAFQKQYVPFSRVISFLANSYSSEYSLHVFTLRTPSLSSLGLTRIN